MAQAVSFIISIIYLNKKHEISCYRWYRNIYCTYRSS
nr:hypothetical protein [Clostridioides difficile]